MKRVVLNLSYDYSVLPITTQSTCGTSGHVVLKRTAVVLKVLGVMLLQTGIP